MQTTTKCDRCGFEIGMKTSKCINCGEPIGIKIPERTGGFMKKLIFILIAISIIRSVLKFFGQ